MGDVNIIIKDGHIVGVDGEDGDDSDLEAFSGSGESDLENTTTTSEPPVYLTPTSNSAAEKITTTKDTDLIPYIIVGVIGLLLLIVVIVFIVWCQRKRRRRKSPSKKSNSGPVVYNPNGEAPGSEGYSVAIPLTIGEPPLEDAPPPPVPASAPPKPPGLSASGGSSGSARYTPLGGRRVNEDPVPTDDEKCSIYESIDDDKVSNVYEEAVPALPKSNSGRRPRPLSSVGEDPNMGSEKDKMLPPSSPV